MRELAHFSQGMTVIGCDEVGRGCLAGPVVAAAVVFDWSKPELIKALRKEVKITDSKLLHEAQRVRAAAAIKRVATGFAVGVVSVKKIDQINILQASLLAMKTAVQKLDIPVKKSLVMVDGNQRIPHLNHAQQTIIGGDAKVFSIAAASIIAKVYRDELMKRLHERFPAYGWHENKGYGTAAHRAALRQTGVTVHHRKSFRLV